MKLAYPSIEDDTRGTIAKDYFIRGLHADMQIALKSNEKFSSTDIRALATEVTRLEIAGIKSNGGACGFTSQVACVDDRSQVVDDITEKVLEKLRAASLDPLMHQDDGGNAIINDVNLLNNNGGNRGRFHSNSGNFCNQGRRGDNRQHSSTRSSQQQQQSKTNRKCRACRSSDYFVRDCPTRFCQACGTRAMMLGTALVRTMINDYMKVRNTLRFYLRIKTA